MKLSNRILASVAVVAALAVAPAAAQAGTVSVEETRGNVNHSVLHFAAAPGEQNNVQVSPVTGGNTAELEANAIVTIRDTGAGLFPGPGCTGGGWNGAPATCKLHLPRDFEYENNCGIGCATPISGTAWQDAMRIELGDGNDSFDGTAFAGSGLNSWPMTVSGGTGDDTIATGTGDDSITPGAGNDVVRPGGGTNRVIADSQPDGNDKLEFEAGALSVVDDSARTEPLHLANHVLGATGEEDTISGFAMVVGGSGDDEFLSSGEWLAGGPGNDKLIGSSGKDYIYGGPGNDTIRGEAGDDWLFGGDGDDTVEGGAGDDHIYEYEVEEVAEESKFDPGSSWTTKQRSSTGNDRILGGEGDDYVRAGSGNDTVEGGPGNDTLYGEEGDDTIEGGAGDDFVGGEEGDDTLRGGEGNDTVSGAYNSEVLGAGTGVDTGVDSIECGPGEDLARANPWDKVTNCAKTQTVRALEVTRIGHNRKHGTARVSFTAQAMKEVTVAIGGKGVRPLTYVPPAPVTPVTKGSFTVRARGSALAKLRHTGRVTLSLAITWEPAGKPSATETRTVNLVMKHKAKRHVKKHTSHHHSRRH
jgi:Ca2+-binding RTX toxin-like protein